MNGKTKIADPVRGLSILTLPCYKDGLTLHADDLTQAVKYTQDLSRLLFSTLLGCGVMCGLVVKFCSDACGKLKFTIDKGLALDCAGDPIQVPEQQTVTIDLCTADGQPKPLTELWFVLCRYHKCCAPRSATCGSDDDETVSVCTREREGFEIRVVAARPECACGCNPQDDTGGEVIEKDAAATKPAAAGAKEKRAKTIEPPPQDGCVDCDNPCHRDHYAGICPCGCCDCDCVILAVARKPKERWEVWHNVRRFIRPVLMRDPQIALDNQANAAAQTKKA
jgi:hypothetical protein